VQKAGDFVWFIKREFDWSYSYGKGLWIPGVRIHAPSPDIDTGGGGEYLGRMEKALDVDRAVKKIGKAGFACDFKPPVNRREIKIASDNQVKKAHSTVVAEFGGTLKILAK